MEAESKSECGRGAPREASHPSSARPTESWRGPCLQTLRLGKQQLPTLGGWKLKPRQIRHPLGITAKSLLESAEERVSVLTEKEGKASFNKAAPRLAGDGQMDLCHQNSLEAPRPLRGCRCTLLGLLPFVARGLVSLSGPTVEACAGWSS